MNNDQKTLLELEKMRKKIVRKTPEFSLMAIIFAVFAAIFMTLFLTYLGRVFFSTKFGGVAALLIFIYFIFHYFKHYKHEFTQDEAFKFIDKYKNFYLKNYINSLGFEYQKIGHIHALDIMKSGLFASFDKQSGNDKISGEIDGVRFVFSDLLIENKIETEDGSVFVKNLPYLNTNYDTKTFVTAFQGLFFMADFHKKINSKTVVLSRSGRQNGEIIAKNRLKDIKMDNTEFNKLFEVFTNDPQNAMYILNFSLMEQLIKLQKMFKDPLSVSFVDNRIFIKVDRGYDSFEPDLNQNIVNKNIAPRIKAELNAMFDIVKILKLNSKIWVLNAQNSVFETKINGKI